MTTSSSTDFYLSQRQFSEMKLGARNQSNDTTKAVAEQFESLFVQQMLAAMRSAAVFDESSHSSTLDLYQEMYDKQLALSISKQGGLGIAKILMQQLPGGEPSVIKSGNSGNSMPAGTVPQTTNLTLLKEVSESQGVVLPPEHYLKNSYQSENPAVVVSKFRTDDLPILEPGAKSDDLVGSEKRWSKPDQFVSDLWPHAERAANKIGISAQALVAQSALETGWGKHTMRFPDGKPAFNLFGIKAGSQWQGATLAKPTLEFRNGVMQTEIAHFRAYDSISDALDDYVQFVQSSSRYQNALDHKGSDAHYLRELQQGGYATDPNYANKIINIMHGKTFEDSIASLDKADSIQEEVNNHA